MSNRFLIVFLILLILGVFGGVLYWADSEGLVDVVDPAVSAVAAVPLVGPRLVPQGGQPATEIRELEELQEERARDQRWSALRKREEELRRAESSLDEERARLGQWEAELERREGAITDRERAFVDREQQYERAVKMYLSMRPAAAARVLSQLEDLEVIEIFRRMPERNVSAILGEMDPSTAGAIMRKMSRAN